MSKESRAFRDAMEELSDLDQGGDFLHHVGAGAEGPAPAKGAVPLLRVRGCFRHMSLRGRFWRAHNLPELQHGNR